MGALDKQMFVPPLMEICSFLKCTLPHTSASSLPQGAQKTRNPFWGSCLVLCQRFLFPWLGDKRAARCTGSVLGLQRGFLLLEKQLVDSVFN